MKCPGDSPRQIVPNKIVSRVIWRIRRTGEKNPAYQDAAQAVADENNFVVVVFLPNVIEIADKFHDDLIGPGGVSPTRIGQRRGVYIDASLLFIGLADGIDCVGHVVPRRPVSVKHDREDLRGARWLKLGIVEMHRKALRPNIETYSNG